MSRVNRMHAIPLLSYHSTLWEGVCNKSPIKTFNEVDYEMDLMRLWEVRLGTLEL